MPNAASHSPSYYGFNVSAARETTKLFQFTPSFGRYGGSAGRKGEIGVKVKTKKCHQSIGISGRGKGKN